MRVKSQKFSELVVGGRETLLSLFLGNWVMLGLAEVVWG